MSDGGAQHGDWRDERGREKARTERDRASTAPQRPDESFENFQGRQLRAQSLAAEETARSVETIKNILVVYAILTVIGALVIAGRL